MIECETLGGRSTFLYSINDGILSIQFGEMPNPIIVQNDIIERVRERINKSIEPDLMMTSNYNQPKWEDCPNNLVCPYVAKLLIIGVI